MKSSFYTFVLPLLALSISLDGQGMPSPGDPAPLIRAQSVLQAPIGRISDWRDLGDNVVVLEFWGTWCGPCVAAIPHLNDLADRFHDRPVRFLSITDEEDWRVRNFLKLKSMSSWICLDPERATFDAYGVNPLPRTFIINRQHRIAAVTTPDALTPELLEKVLSGSIEAAQAKPPAPPKPGGQVSDSLVEAVIRPAKPAGGFKRTATSFTARGMALRQLISTVYGVPPNHLSFNSPLADSTYAVDVRVPEGSESQLTHLVQQAIGAACDLHITTEAKDTEVYVLKAGTAGTKLRRVDGPEKTIIADAGQIVSRATLLKHFAMVLEGTVGRPIVDETNLEGVFDLAIYWDVKDPRSAIAAVREQLGLEIVPDRRPIDMLVVNVGAATR